MFEKYLDLEFKEKGRGNDGVDCYGLFRMIYANELGISLPSFTEYENTKDYHAIKSLIQNNSEKEWYEVETPQKFDGVLFRIFGHPVHMGLMIDENRFIHIEHGFNSCVEWYNGSMWKNRLIGFYRHREMHHGNSN